MLNLRSAFWPLVWRIHWPSSSASWQQLLRSSDLHSLLKRYSLFSHRIHYSWIRSSPNSPILNVSHIFKNIFFFFFLFLSLSYVGYHTGSHDIVLLPLKKFCWCFSRPGSQIPSRKILLQSPFFRGPSFVIWIVTESTISELISHDIFLIMQFFFTFDGVHNYQLFLHSCEHFFVCHPNSSWYSEHSSVKPYFKCY